MNFTNLVDFRDEFYVKNLRRWVVIDTLCRNRKFANGVALHKAAFVDFLLCNPNIMQCFLVNFGRAQQTLNLDELLYRDNIEFGSMQELSDFSKTCILLISKKYIGFHRSEGEIFFFPGEFQVSIDADSIKRWHSEVNMLLPLMGKSLNVLHNSILGALHGS